MRFSSQQILGHFSWKWNDDGLFSRSLDGILLLSQSNKSNSHSSLGNIQGNQLHLTQTMSNVPVIWSTRGAFDQVSEDMPTTEQKPSLCHVHHVMFTVQNILKSLIGYANIWFIVNCLLSITMWRTPSMYSTVVVVVRRPDDYGSFSRFSFPILYSATDICIVDKAVASSTNVAVMTSWMSFGEKILSSAVTW